MYPHRHHADVWDRPAVSMVLGRLAPYPGGQAVTLATPVCVALETYTPLPLPG